ncbi:sulfate permease, SulP family [Reichenbachiella faecimaris]|uniref:Sulfate permease, SulP family n=1 Tax=Reichenbachiella faecimaris TaxID=692418 RepID=A0A1W2G9S0_REIFA|nr:sulfate permease [Reichenbachiella faecimaris]SMD33056.1 sulfate permease, SulP family [Reichenbachiella faecimaris]
MKNLLPIIDSLKHYTKEGFKNDLFAGLVVGVMLIPQGMAYAMIAGLPPIYGLYTAIIPTILYALLGSSRHVSVGPVAMDSLILVAGASAFATVGSEEYIVVVAGLTLMVGAIQLSLGFFKLGFIANFLSKPVILGFTFAAAVIISIKQLRYLTGITPVEVDGLLEELLYYFTHASQIHFPTLWMAIGSLFFLVFGKKIVPKFPISLLIVVLGLVLSYLLQLEHFGVSLVGYLPSGLPTFHLPVLAELPLGKFIPLAITLALMGFVEIYSIGQHLQSKHKAEYEINSNKELIGLGFANVVGSLFRTFPATASFSRSAVNESSGAKTNLASVISSLIVILTLLFLMPIFQYLPHAVLGAIIFVAVLGLIDFKITKNLWHNDRYDFIMLLASFLGTLVLGIEWGIGFGILISLLVLVYKTSTPHMATLGRVGETSYFRNLDRFESAVDDKEVSILRFDARLFFANVGSLKAKIEQLVKQKPGMKKFILDAQSIIDIDSSGIEGLEDIMNLLNENDIQFHMVSIIGPVRDKLYRTGLSEKIGLNQIHDCIDDAIKGKQYQSKLAYQTNVKK